MKRLGITLLAILMIVTVSVSAVQIEAFADYANRNVYIDLDHSYDQAIYDGYVNRVTDMIDDIYGLRKATFKNQLEYVLFTHPELVGVTYYNRWFLAANDQTTAYEVRYVNDEQYYTDFAARLPKVLAEVKALLPANATEFQKVHVAHDYICSTTAYDKINIDNNVYPPNDFDASGVFVNHYSACQGYSLAYKYILDNLGVECAMVQSGKGQHAWNVVKIDGEWYHVDLTSDDKGFDILGRVEHDYMCISTETLLSRRSICSDFVVVPDDYNTVFTDDICATSKKYESGQIWNGCNSNCHYYNGKLYTIGADGCLYEDGVLYFAPDENMVWHPYGNIYAQYFSTYGTLSALGNTLYMLSPKNIYKVNLDTKETEIVYSLDGDEAYGTQIFGLARIEGVLYCTENVDTPAGNETWIPVFSGGEPEPEAKKPAIIDPKSGSEVGTVQVYQDMGKSVELSLANIPESVQVAVESDNDAVAKAVYSEGKLTVNCFMDGTSDITVTVGETALTVKVTVIPVYSKIQDITVDEGQSFTFVDDTGDYAETYTAMLLDTAVANVTVNGITEQGTAGTAAKLDKASSPGGSYIVGTGNGRYLVKSGSSLSSTADAESATKWNVSGSGSNITISADGYYLVHSTSGVSLSTSSSNSGWSYSTSNGFSFSASKKILFWTTTTNYYLNGGNSFSVGTSASSPVFAYNYTPGTPAVPGRNITEITFSGINNGSTQTVVGETLYKITVEEYVQPTVQTITVNIIDDVGDKLANSYQISGSEGTAYKITPLPISGYITPAEINGTYGNAPDAEINLVYILNTNKTALKSELDNAYSADGYTTDSYSVYSSAIEAGRGVYNNGRATQAQVDSAVTAILNAKNKLEKVQTAQFIRDTDGINSGSEYVICSNGKALAVVNGKLTAVSINASSGKIASADDNCIWVISSSGSGYTLRNKATGQYLGYSTSGSIFSRSCSMTLSSSSTVWKAKTGDSNIRFYVSSGLSSFYIIGNGSFSMNKSTSGADLELYKKS